MGGIDGLGSALNWAPTSLSGSGSTPDTDAIAEASADLFDAPATGSLDAGDFSAPGGSSSEVGVDDLGVGLPSFDFGGQADAFLDSLKAPETSTASAPPADTPKAAAPKAAAPEVAKPTPTAKATTPAPSTPAGPLDVTDASQALKGKFGVDEAWGKVLALRDRAPGDPTYDQALKEVQSTLGIKGTPSKTDLRDIEHYLYASLATREGALGALPKADDSYGTRVAKTLDREVKGAAMVATTVGYSAAKWIGQNTPVDPLKLVGGDSRDAGTSKASWAEVKAGLKGVWDGLVNP